MKVNDPDTLQPWGESLACTVAGLARDGPAQCHGQDWLAWIRRHGGDARKRASHQRPEGGARVVRRRWGEDGGHAVSLRFASRPGYTANRYRVRTVNWERGFHARNAGAWPALAGPAGTSI